MFERTSSTALQPPDFIGDRWSAVSQSKQFVITLPTNQHRVVNPNRNGVKLFPPGPLHHAHGNIAPISIRVLQVCRSDFVFTFDSDLFVRSSIPQTVGISKTHRHFRVSRPVASPSAAAKQQQQQRPRTEFY